MFCFWVYKNKLSTMKHIQELNDHLEENEGEGIKVSTVDYDEKNLLYLRKSCSAFLFKSDKTLVVATLMAAIDLEWEDLKEWFEINYIGKKERSDR